MERERVKNTPKSQKHSQIEVVTDWRHTKEISPAFKRLMILLLKPRNGQLSETKQTDEEH